MLNNNHKFFILPGWVYRAIIRNNFNIIDALNYSKIRQIMSLNDIRDWLLVSRLLYVDDTPITGYNPELHFTNLDEKSKLELNNTIIPYIAAVTAKGSDVLYQSDSPETDEIANIKARLGKSIELLDQPAYRFVSTADTTFIILNEGFLDEMKEPAFKLAFIRELLIECYKVYQVPYVSAYIPIFRTYLKICSEM